MRLCKISRKRPRCALIGACAVNGSNTVLDLVKELILTSCSKVKRSSIDIVRSSFKEFLKL